MSRTVRRWALAGFLVLAAPVALFSDWLLDGPVEANAALSVAYTLDELVAQTPEAAVVKAVEKKSVWEKIAGGKRIVTYTKLERVRGIYGSVPEELWVRTLGGAVGRIGQQVAGEAQFRIDKESVVFLTKTPKGTYVVSGAAQGHYPVLEEDSNRRLGLSPNRGRIVKGKNKQAKSIQEVLEGIEVVKGITEIKAAKARVDANKKSD